MIIIDKKQNDSTNNNGYMNESANNYFKRTGKILNLDKFISEQGEIKTIKISELTRKKQLSHIKTKKIPLISDIEKKQLERISTTKKHLKSIILSSLKDKNYQPSEELVIHIEKKEGIKYKRNTISEACTQLIMQKILSKRNKNKPKKRGRPKTEFYLSKLNGKRYKNV